MYLCFRLKLKRYLVKVRSTVHCTYLAICLYTVRTYFPCMYTCTHLPFYPCTLYRFGLLEAVHEKVNMYNQLHKGTAASPGNFELNYLLIYQIIN